MESIKLDENDDIVIVNGDFAIASGQEDVIQCAEAALGTNKGEWFLNPDQGIRFEVFETKNPDDEVIRSEINEGLFQEPRIVSVESIEIEKNIKKRTMDIRFQALGVDGEIIERGLSYGD